MKVEILFILVGIFLAVLGILIKHMKLYGTIAGYNTMSSEEKANFNVEKFASIMRNVFMMIGLLIVISSIISILFNIVMLSPVVTIIAVTTGVIYLNIQGAIMRRKSKKDF